MASPLNFDFLPSRLNLKTFSAPWYTGVPLLEGTRETVPSLSTV